MIDRAYLSRLIDAAHIDYYASGIDGARCFWPWRMNKAGGATGHGARKSHADMCDSYVLDSNFTDSTVTNEDVLAEAADLNADAAVLADVYHDCDQTVAALREGLSLAKEHKYDGTLVLPLQPPHNECYQRVRDAVGTQSVWWAIGGLKDDPVGAKVDAARDLREAVGPNSHIHGLGFGITPRLGEVVRNNPDLLDSVDNATAMSNSVDILSGSKEKMTIAAAEATAARLKALRRATPFAEDSPAAQRPAAQTGLTEFGTAVATDGGADDV